MKTFFIFDNQIIVAFDKKLINTYENICGPLGEKYLEHLVYASGLTNEDNPDDIQKELIEALNEEIEINSQVPEKINNLVKKGFIK